MNNKFKLISKWEDNIYVLVLFCYKSITIFNFVIHI